MKRKLNYRFHDPNPTGIAAEYILKVLIEANVSKVEKAIKEAKMRMMAEENPKNAAQNNHIR